MNNKLTRFALFCSAIHFFSLVPVNAVIAADAKVGDGAEIEEIVVTANKRQESINDVGVAITVLSGEVLRNQKVVTLDDLANAIPGLSYTLADYGPPVFTLRGVGFYESSLAAYPTTSAYLDEVPLSFPALTRHVFFDLERVEVLKGPQGTLFGQNSTGGAINFIAAKPTDTFEGGADFTYGRFNHFEGNAFVSGPLSETMKARLALNGARSDEWQNSHTRDDELGELEYYAGRLLLDFTPSDRLNIQINLNGWKDKSEPQAPQYQSLVLNFPHAASAGLTSHPQSPLKPRAADWTASTRPFADNRLLQAAGRIDWEIIDGITATAISSYVDYKQDRRFDLDGLSLDPADFDVPVHDGQIKTFSQEVRVANSDSSAFRWLVGANYETSDVDELRESYIEGASNFPVFGFTGTSVTSYQNMHNYAFFTSGEYDLNDQFTAKAGVRYTDAYRRANSCTASTADGTLGVTIQGLATAIQLGFIPLPGVTPTGVPVPPIGLGCVSLDNVTFDGTPATFLPSGIRDVLKEDNVSWRVGFDYKLTEDALLYVNVAQGYKAGSVALISAATLEQYTPVTEESLLSYEAGFKLTMLDRRVQVSGAGFYYDYDDKQLRAAVLQPIFGALFTLRNIDKSRIYGFELDSTFRPVPGLVLGFSGSILDSEVTDYMGLDTEGAPFDFSGSDVPYTPKYQVRLSADYTWQMGAAEPFLGIVFSHRSETDAIIGGADSFVVPPGFASSVPVDETFDLPSYSLVDLRAGASFNDGQWTVTVFGNNVFNEYYVTNIYTAYDTLARFSGQPATYGVTVAFKFD